MDFLFILLPYPEFAFSGIIIYLFLKHIVKYQGQGIIDVHLLKNNHKFLHYIKLSIISRQCTGAMYFVLLFLFSEIFNLKIIEVGKILFIYGLGIWSAKLIFPKLLKYWSLSHLLFNNLIGLSISIISIIIAVIVNHFIYFIILSYILGVITSIHHSCLNTLSFSSINKSNSIAASSIVSLIMYISQSTAIAIFSLIFYILSQYFHYNSNIAIILSISFLEILIIYSLFLEYKFNVYKVSVN